MKSSCESSPTGARRPSGSPARSALLLLVLALAILSGAAPARGPDVSPPTGAAFALEEARRLLREGETDPGVLRRVEESGGLFRVRARLLAASLALARGDRAEVVRALERLPHGPAGLEALPPYLAAAASGRAEDLLAFALGTKDPLFARAALLTASEVVRGEAARRAVRDAMAALPADPARSPRAAIARAVALSRLAPSREETRQQLAALAEKIPDAVERAADLFEPEDAKAFRDAVQTGPDAVRLERAKAIVSREADEALALAGSLPKTPENRLALAELAVGAGRFKEARRALEWPAFLVFDDPASTLHVRALDLRARLMESAAKAKTRRPRRKLPIRGTSPMPVPRAASREASELAALLAAPLDESDRKPLLLGGLRLALREGRREDAVRLVEGILALDASSSAGAEELFLDAFTLYRTGERTDVAQAARLWEEQLARYQVVTVRRRATYWAGKAHAALGQRHEARAHWASLVSGTSADVYGRWAAAALGVPLSPPAVSFDPPEPELPHDAPGARSRELLACGLPGLAEDAAEEEGSLDQLFAARLASERGDHRRATSLLKARYPALGTPEEGAVPLQARRAYYPLGASRVLRRAAQEQGVPPALLFALVRQESLFQPAVRSRAGAVGLMQVMPSTGRLLHRQARLKGRPDLVDPDVNARLGASYLAQLLDMFGGDAAAALAAYNAGPGRVKRWRREAEGLTSDEFLEAIPLTEPREYVRRILFYEGAYAALYGLRPGAMVPDAVPAL